MSPVARSRRHAGRALAVSAAGVALALALAFGVAVLANRGSVDIQLGDETFEGQDAESAAERIDEGGPIIFPDAAGGDRDIYLQHLGDDPEHNWLAFAARPAGVPRRCTLQWQPADSGHTVDGVFRLLDAQEELSGPCDGTEFPADGSGLAQYPVTVREGRVYVDLNAAERTSTSTGG